MRRFLGRLLSFLRLKAFDDDLSREIDTHLALLQEAYEARGMSQDAARRAARVSLGGVEQTKALHRDARSFVWLEDARQDITHAVRLLRRSPLFTLTAGLSLAIGIGANTAVFAVTNSLLFRPPVGVTEPDTLVDIGTSRGDGGLNPLPYATYLEIVRNTTTLSGVFAQDLFPHVMSLVSSESGTAERTVGQTVTRNFFRVLGARPAVGRLFSDGDDESQDVAVLDHDFWVRRFNRDPAVLGRVIRVNGRPRTIVGIASEGFQGTGMQTRDIWLSVGPDKKGSVIAGGRLRPDGSVDQAAREIGAIGDSVARALGSSQNPAPLTARSYSRAGANRNLVAGFAAAVMILVSLVLTVACANVAGVLLARSAVRKREMALRTALGAGRARLVRQLLTETMLLFALGAVLGLILAQGMILLAPLVVTVPTPIAETLTLDWRVSTFVMALSLLSALASGLIPAFRGSRADPVTSLKDDTRSASGRSRLRGAFVVAQVALSILVVVLAGLFVRALRHAGAASPGFDPQGVEVATLDLSMSGDNDATGPVFWRSLAERVRQVPGIESASLVRVPPGGWEGIGLGGVSAGPAAASSEVLSPAWNIVDVAYFRTLGIRLVSGRDFSNSDVTGGPPVAIVADGLGRRLWPGQNAVGKYLTIHDFNFRTQKPETRNVLIVGVVGDIKSSSLIDGLAEPYVYLPLEQFKDAGFTVGMSIVARSAGANRLAPNIGAVVAALNPNLVVVKTETLQQSIAYGLTPQRWLAAIAGTFGLVGLLLAAIGIYGVVAYTVESRRKEFGIRMALGARRAAIIWMVLKQGMVFVGAGAIVGLSLATGAGHVLSVFLYGLPAIHAPTFLGALLLFGVVAAIACYLPARHAIGVDPSRALRND